MRQGNRRQDGQHGDDENVARRVLPSYEVSLGRAPVTIAAGLRSNATHTAGGDGPSAPPVHAASGLDSQGVDLLSMRMDMTRKEWRHERA